MDVRAFLIGLSQISCLFSTKDVVFLREEVAVGQSRNNIFRDSCGDVKCKRAFKRDTTLRFAPTVLVLRVLRM